MRAHVLILALAARVCTGEVVTPLRSAGYSLIPAPRQVELTGPDVRIDSSWSIVNEAAADTMAARRLTAGATELHGATFNGAGPGRIRLRIVSGTVAEPREPALAEQAYRLRIAPNEIDVTGNAAPGLFYGVQSLLQLMRADGAGRWRLPQGEVIDWPALELRFIHWDTKHHQDRPETLKRFIDWAAFFKANAIGFEIEDKYEYPRHPVIGAPGAFTRDQMRELTAYALERHIQLVPQIQSPAHMAYVLKHDQFAHLRADGINYQVSLCDEEAMRLIEDMYQDMIDATPGVKYFHVSTDEVYFAGASAKCREKRPYNEENRSLTWVEYVQRMHSWLAGRGRRMLCWVEYPLLTKHLELLPPGLINGVIGPGSNKEWVQALKARGVKSLVYSSQQGGELLFPNYLTSDFPYRRRPFQGHIEEPAHNVAATITSGADVMGTYAAAWDDSGLHNELFWLGWATVTQYGWSPEAPGVEQSVADFMDVFYGPGNQDMVEIYRTLMEAARFYEATLDEVPATQLKPSYGSWAGKGRGTTRVDLRIEPPALPFAYDEEIYTGDGFRRRYREALGNAPQMRKRIDQAIHALQGKLGTSTRNRYNIEVLLSIGYFERHFTDMLLALQRAEELLMEASAAQHEERHKDAIGLLRRVHSAVEEALDDRARTFANLKNVWEKSRYPKGQSVGGRHFVHILDDLKDHHADRRPGLDYMVEPLENIDLEDWNNRLSVFTSQFARALGVEE